MPTFRTPSVDADEAFQALQCLAHATRTLDNPTEISSVIGSLSRGLGSLEQTLHQLGQFHDGPALRGRENGDSRSARAVSYQVAWELHRAAEIVRQVAAGLDRAHKISAGIVHDEAHCPPIASRQERVFDSGLSL